MRYFLFCLLLFMSSISLLAQKKVTIDGIIVDENQETLIAATVVLLNLQDSSFVSYGLTSETGIFQLKGNRNSTYLLQVSFLGYTPYEQKITLLQDTSLNTIVLTSGTSLFDSIMVTADHIPVQMRGDTLAFNSAAFSIQAHDDVEQLLQQLPGLEVQEDGSITINGKVVTQILVDGKEFFGDNAQAVLKTLPADAINKIEVTNAKKTKDGEDAVDDEKTIDLKLKEEAKTGWMGNVEGGYGYKILPGPSDNHRYKGRLNLNYFNKKMYLTAYGGVNNINQSPLAFDVTGSSSSFQRGVVRSIGAGVNADIHFSEKTNLNLSYVFGNTQNVTDINGFQQSILEENFYKRNSTNKTLNKNNRHNVYSRLAHDFDEYHSMQLTTRFNYNNGNTQRTNQEETLGQGDSLQNVINQNYVQNNDRWNISPTLTFQKEFKNKKGRRFSSRIGFTYTNTSSFSDNNGVTAFYEDSAVLSRIDTLAQEQYGQSKGLAYNTTISWREPIGKDNTISFELYARGQNSENDQEAFDVLSQERISNSLLTDRYQKFLDHQELKTTFKRKTKEYLLRMQVGFRRSGLRGTIGSNPIPIIQAYYYPTANLRFRYFLSKQKKLTLSYNLRFQEPRVEQLQPIINNENPLAVSIGNPNLIPEYWHSIRFRSDLYQLSNFTNFYGALSMNFIQNTIIRSQTLDENFKTTYQPVNSGLSYRGVAQFGVNTIVKPLEMKVDFKASVNIYQSALLLNDVLAKQFNHDYKASLTLTNKKKKVVDASIFAKVTIGNSIYESNNALNVTYVNHAYGAKVRVTIAKKWNIQSNFNYSVYANAGFGSALAVPIWSASINRTFLKSDALRIGFSAENLLNEAFLVNRSSRNGILTSNETNLLGRYFMLSLTYKIKA